MLFLCYFDLSKNKRSQNRTKCKWKFKFFRQNETTTIIYLVEQNLNGKSEKNWWFYCCFFECRILRENIFWRRFQINYSTNLIKNSSFDEHTINKFKGTEKTNREHCWLYEIFFLIRWVASAKFKYVNQTHVLFILFSKNVLETAFSCGFLRSSAFIK